VRRHRNAYDRRLTAGTGSYQQYVLSPAKYTARIPDGVPDHVAAPIMCSATTMVRSLTDSGLRPGNWAVFPGGGGGVGIQGVQIARAMGLRPIVVDSGAEKRALALEMGAEHFVDFRETESVAEEVKRIADGIGAHGVFVTAPAAYGGAMDMVGDRVGGAVMCIGLPSLGSTKLELDPSWCIGRNRKVSGTLVGTMQDVGIALDYARRGLLKNIAEVYPIDKLPDAVEKLRKGLVAGRMVVDFNARSEESKPAEKTEPATEAPPAETKTVETVSIQ
jgi:propanol-preferring alcohol dehydrogenase